MAESSTSQYRKILQAHGVNTRKYGLVEVIENDCIVTWVGVYNEILPEPSGNPSGSTLGISLGLMQYFIVQYCIALQKLPMYFLCSSRIETWTGIWILLLQWPTVRLAVHAILLIYGIPRFEKSSMYKKQFSHIFPTCAWCSNSTQKRILFPVKIAG